MSKNLQIYKPMLKVLTWSDEVYYTDAKNFDRILKVLESSEKSFVEIDGVILNKKEIKNVTPVKDTVSEYADLPRHLREKADFLIERAKTNLNLKKLPPEKIQAIVKKVLSENN